ncbi:hypothetical protein ACYOEI_06740 [Singulisphaera rosea]
MRLLFASLLLVSILATCRFRGLRPWVIGVSLIACGFGVDIAYVMWCHEFAARLEMVLFAVVEASLFVPGLALVSISLATTWPPDAGRILHGVAWLLWMVGVIVTIGAVINRLPS